MNSSVIAELEGTLVKDPDPFPYFMLIAFEASGPIRFSLLLLFWPVIRLLDLLGMKEASLRLTIFIAIAGLPKSEIEYVGRAVLPKFYMDNLNNDAWKIFSRYEKKVVVTRTPRVMVERFLKMHLGANEVIGSELIFNRFGFATGWVRDIRSISDRVDRLFGNEEMSLALGRWIGFDSPTFVSLCKNRCHERLTMQQEDGHIPKQPHPVIFHDGRLVKHPKPITALLILLWFPIAIILAIIRVPIGLAIPLRHQRNYMSPILGYRVLTKNPPNSSSVSAVSSKKGVLYVCNHRTVMDPLFLSRVLGQNIPAVVYSMSPIWRKIAPIRTVHLTRSRSKDAEMIAKELENGDLVICPEGTTCREPFLLRFSSLFAELTDDIVPVAINYKPQLFHATTARGRKVLDAIFFLMNPLNVYEISFLKKISMEDSSIAGKSSYEIANHVQRLLADALGFQCTDFTRKYKYRLLAGNDGIVAS
ncbi:glycerol-3-phosphate acyltransferase 7-like [Amaranthus tricolor]|uniref:glycerol-3-phosphate acyltransferase 7-like n=1 Tax=Amaranthus tricolor TaxID=29722 RepID=UPI002585F4CA|nr:glycerol-3-phosphate acyltransferase 7-like [Amaranthus tricolor]